MTDPVWWGEATDEPAREDARPTAIANCAPPPIDLRPGTVVFFIRDSFQLISIRSIFEWSLMLIYICSVIPGPQLFDLAPGQI
jgi:hypothetical protein